MKKAISKVFALALAVMMAICLAACAQNNGQFASVEDYLANEQVQEQLQPSIDSVKNMGMDLEITGEGNKLIYTYTFTTQLDEDGVAEQLKTGLDAQASTFEGVASNLKDIVNVDNPVVVVTYLNKDGTVLHSQEFSAK